MKQLLILSGKGGTGKTTLASAIIRLSEAKACADCDVDAPNLHLVMDYKGETERKDYYGLPKAFIDAGLCTHCGSCLEICRFEAVISGKKMHIDPRACEGCGLCERICPVGAIDMHPSVAGELRLLSDQEKGIFSTAQLKMGNGTTGLLVTEVKKQMIKASDNASLAVIDGSPGIGCPVIASITGVDMILIVTEPSLSGISDMDRILDTARRLGSDITVCVNKADTNQKMTEQIRDRCLQMDVPYTGEIPFDPEAVRIVNKGLTLADEKCPAGDAIRSVFENVMNIMNRR